MSARNMSVHKKARSGALLNLTALVPDAPSEIGIQEIQADVARRVHRFYDCTPLHRYLRTRRAILNGEKLFDLSARQLRARGLMRPFTLNVYKTALAALPAITLAWVISLLRQTDSSSSAELYRKGYKLWDAVLVALQPFQTAIQQTAIAMVVPAVFLVVAVAASESCLHRLDSSRDAVPRCQKAFLYFDAVYGLLPQMFFTTALILYLNSDWVIERLSEDAYYAFNFVMGFPLALAGLWPGYVLWVQIPRLLFDLNGYGDPEGITSASTPLPRPWMKSLCGTTMTALVAVPLVQITLWFVLELGFLGAAAVKAWLSALA